MIDQETRRVVERVNGSLAEDIQTWFAAHLEVEIVVRDRSADYRKGLTFATLSTSLPLRSHRLMHSIYPDHLCRWSALSNKV